MSYQKDRDEFVGVIVAEIVRKPRKVFGPHGQDVSGSTGIELARLLLRNAAMIQRIAVKAYNRELSHGEKRAFRIARIRICEACKPWGIVPYFNGAPRGACVKLILLSGRWNSFGGRERGFCVPTR